MEKKSCISGAFAREAQSERCGAPGVRKFGYLCIQEILALTKSSVRMYVHRFMLADVKWYTY